MREPIIGITSSKIIRKEEPFLGDNLSYSSVDYVRAIEMAGGMPVILPLTENLVTIDDYLEICDGILFPGGPDIHPVYYNEPPKIGLNRVHTDLDEFQIMLMKKAIAQDKPILGICRGMQLMNIVRGGKLFQDLSELNSKIEHYMKSEKYEIAHNVFIEQNTFLNKLFGENIYVNSFHHQIISSLGENVKAIAWAEGDIIEAIMLEDKNFVMGVQWHPEMMLIKDNQMLPLFNLFINKANKKTGGE